MDKVVIECRWLNKNFGDGYWICNGLLKPCNEEICSKCKDYSPKKGNNYEKL